VVLELASVHVPKVGGTSFVQVLLAWYGRSMSQYYTCNGTVEPVHDLTRVVHGHYYVGEFEGERTIMWMRDPARRVISHYYYWRLTPPQVGIDPIHVRMREENMPLLEFAALPEMRDLHSQYFAGHGVDDLDFVGVLEHTDAEMLRLAHVLDKRPLRLPRINDTATEEYAAFKRSAEYKPALERVRELNALDYALYDRAVERMHEWWAERQDAARGEAAAAA
jgi:hypothetical protein